jgi:hypothetical protein
MRHFSWLVLERIRLDQKWSLSIPGQFEQRYSLADITQALVSASFKSWSNARSKAR